MLVATVNLYLIFIISTIVSILIPLTDVKSISQQFIKAFILVALVAAFSKYVIVKQYAQKNKEFNEPFDGIVYVAKVSIGFALYKIVYTRINMVWKLVLLEHLHAVPAHATFRLIMGYFIRKAKLPKNRMQLNLLGLFLATLFHGYYHIFLFINFISGFSIGAIISLVIGIILSRKAIKSHQNSSKFKA